MATVEVGDLVTAEMLGLALDPPRGRISASGTQALADATQVAIAFTVEDIDSDGQHDTVTNNSRVTPNVAGTYRFFGTGFMDGLATGVSFDCNLRKNGSTNLAPGARTVGSAQVTGINCTVLVDMNGTTDYIELMLRQDSAGADVTTQSAQFTCVLEWQLVSGA